MTDDEILNYLFRDGHGHGEIQPRWLPGEVVPALVVAAEVNWPFMNGSEPLMLAQGETLTCRYPNGATRFFEIVTAGLAHDVMLRRLP